MTWRLSEVARPKKGEKTFIIDHYKLPVRPARQMFILDEGILDAVKFDEVHATVDALKSLNLYRLPFDTIDLRMKADAILKPPEGIDPLGPEAEATFYGLSTTPDSSFKLVLTWINNHHWWGEVIPKEMTIQQKDGEKIKVEMDQLRVFFCDLIVTLLATRNTAKETVHHKAVRLGIGKHKDRHEYTTTLRLPRVMEDHPDVPVHSGREVCPHLRRAHIRNQRYGPGWQYTRQVLIEACFVNADKEWTKTRTAYNVSMGKLK